MRSLAGHDCGFAIVNTECSPQTRRLPRLNRSSLAQSSRLPPTNAPYLHRARPTLRDLETFAEFLHGRESLGIERFACSGQGSEHRGSLLDRARRKRWLLLDSGDEFRRDLRAFLFGCLLVDAFGETGNLIIWPQPAHQPALFFP